MRISYVPLLAAAAAVPLLAQALGVQVLIDGKTVTLVDVPQSAWFATYVRESAEAGVVSGYRDANGQPTGKFGPSNSITIAEALKIVSEGAGYDEQQYSVSINSGVDHWSSPYVSVAKAEGFAVIDERTHLDFPATRAQVAALFTSAFRVDTDRPTANNYTDVSASTTYHESIDALTIDGVVSGDTDVNNRPTGHYRPTDNINRAEVAKMDIESRAEYGTPGVGRKPDEASGESQVEGNVVTYSDTGFSPQVLRIKKGESVTFKNETTIGLWVASDPHPVHTDLSGFDAGKAVLQGGVYVYTFTKAGTWGYHNHTNASHKGTIIVE